MSECFVAAATTTTTTTTKPTSTATTTNMRRWRPRQFVAIQWFIKILIYMVLLLGQQQPQHRHQLIEGAEINKDTADDDVFYFVEIGNDVTLTCETNTFNTSWRHGEHIITKQDGRYSLEYAQTSPNEEPLLDAAQPTDSEAHKYSLTLHKVQLGDEGNYTCRTANGTATADTRNPYQLRPFALPKVVASNAPKVKQKIGHAVSLYCTFELYPHNETVYKQFKWLKDDTAFGFLDKYTTHTPLNRTHLNYTLALDEVYKKENGSYACVAYDAIDTTAELARAEIALLVMDLPQVSIDYAKAVGASQIYLNWTVNDGNDPIKSFYVQTAKEDDAAFSYYKESIGGKNTSFVVESLMANTSYLLRLSAKNSIGDGNAYQYPLPVRTLATDPEFIPDVKTTGSTSSTITIGWHPPPPELLEYIHYYDLIVSQHAETSKFTQEAVHLQNSRNLPYMFDNLKPATDYEFKVRACNELTSKCGNWSTVVNGTTMDGQPSKPTDLRVECVHNNVSRTSKVVVTWNVPAIPNGKLKSYNVNLTGLATYVDAVGSLVVNQTWGPTGRHVDEIQPRRVVYESVDANTNYTVTVSAMTRIKRFGESAVAKCVMPVSTPTWLRRPIWKKMQTPNNMCQFNLRVPRLSERNGPICCYRIYLVRRGGDYRNELPPPDKLNVSTYHEVHAPNNSVGGAYIAEMFAVDAFKSEIVLGDGERYFGTARRPADVDQACRRCLDGEPFLRTHKPESHIPRMGGNTAPTDVMQANAELTQREHLNKSGNLTEEYSKILENKKRRRRYPRIDEHRQHQANGNKTHSELFLMNASQNELVDGSAAVADMKLYEDVFDGEIDMNSNYTGFIEVIVRDKTTVLTAYSDYFDIITPGTVAEHYESVDNISAMLNIFIQVLIVLIFIVVGLLIVLCILHRYNVRHSVPGDEVIGLRDSLRRLFGGRSANHRHFIGTSNAKSTDMGPIHKNDMYLAYTNRHKDTDYGFLREYEMLPNRFSDRTTKNSDMKENAMKNRYPDIKAYDQTRVKLSQMNGIQGSDYINANFVIGYKERKKFICAQGPMESTINDFWRMIWEQHLEIIVMLTNLEEYNKSKCAKYWPEKIGDMKQFGDITVKFVGEKKMGDYLTRNLDIFKRSSTMQEPEQEDERRQITQYHYLVWKDFMAPEHPHGIIKFIRHINAVYSVQRGPILVHCSAGVGRTGTLVALDSLMQQLEEEDQVAIFNTVCDLRHQRNFLVQSLKQYIFLYRALLDTAHFGNTELNASYLSAAIDNLKQKGVDGKDKCKLEIEFDRLLSVQDETNKSCAVGTNEENNQKNRSELIIPYDRNRVILSPIPMRENSTYINASFIEGYENSETFIITQDPMENTIADLWRMVSEQSICTLVMISEIGDGPRKCPRYWADDEIQYDHIQVKYMQSESCPYYTRREFNVTNCKIDDTIRVTQFQYNGWPTVDGEVPEVCRGIIELVDQALNHHNKEKNIGCRSPIAVHCGLGTDRSSIFVAMCILVQQLRTEKCIDICSTARKIRSQRQGLLNTYAQYEFLHRAIANYADLHKLSVESSPTN